MKKGQTLLITMLVLTVATTIALSLIGRASTDVGITGQNEESARAFAAAEAGVEELLKTGTPRTDVQVDENTKFTATIANIGSGEVSAVYTPSSATNMGELETVWLVSHDEATGLPSDAPPKYTEGSIDVCFTHEATGQTKPALEITAIYKGAGDAYAIQRGAYDPDSGRRGSNSFADVSDQNNGCGKSDVYRANVLLPANALMLRIRPYYANTLISVAPVNSAILPSQGTEITSTGQTGSGVIRRIVVNRQYQTPPSFLDFTIYSQGSFAH
jgi:Tfp pilus assembly protein PilX